LYIGLITTVWSSDMYNAPRMPLYFDSYMINHELTVTIRIS